MRVELKRNIILGGGRYRKQAGGIEIPGRYAGQLPSDAVLLEASAEEKHEFEKAKKERTEKQAEAKPADLRRVRRDLERLERPAGDDKRFSELEKRIEALERGQQIAEPAKTETSGGGERVPNPDPASPLSKPQDDQDETLINPKPPGSKPQDEAKEKADAKAAAEAKPDPKSSKDISILQK